MATTGIIHVENETTSTSTRLTKEGKTITYVMNVIQQPERARACGSGAKSSADRRPVDPPPIVELRIFDGPNRQNDITFSYNANFFLFATLENARHLAQGRVPPPSQPAFPVLTGTPVAGMAYLDRPSPAGYFIFPDLSVRHEGKYRLGFSLYEELKDQKDMDSETPQNAEIQKSAHVSHRLEVKSTPFTVFSAKKFPGLTESTALSRLVAEQGCRVRIRRDVRMRRRETKGNREYDEYEEDGVYERARRTATPDAYGSQHSVGTPQMPMHDIDRPRSVSNASAVSHMTGRRPSMEQMNQAYQQAPQQQYSTPMTPQTPQGMYPPQMPPQWQQPQPVNYMQPPPPSYPQQGYAQPTPPVSGQYNNFMTPQFPSYDQQNHHMRHNSVEYPAPPSGPPPPAPATSQPMQYPTSSQPMAPFGQLDNSYGRQHMHVPPIQPLQAGHQSMPGPMQPPLNTSPQYGAGPAHSPLDQKHDSISPYAPQASTVQHPMQEQPGYYTGAPVAPPKFSHAPQPSGATKRTYGASFDEGYNNQPLRLGARPPMSPSEPKYGYGMEGSCDDEPQTPVDDIAMSYRRADGTERRRRVPPSS